MNLSSNRVIDFFLSLRIDGINSTKVVSFFDLELWSNFIERSFIFVFKFSILFIREIIIGKRILD